MTNDSAYTDEEKKELRQLYKKICIYCDELNIDGSKSSNIKQLKAYVNDAVENGSIKRDAFGFHPILVALHTAEIAESEIKLRGEALIACILQSCQLDEESRARIETDFGTGVYKVLHGLNKLGQLYEKNAKIDSENFRNLLVSFAEDMRVILLMIANRVYLMRNIKESPNDEERCNISAEAAYLYAPLAHKLGLYKLKSELEDLSLKYLEHDAYYHIKDKLNATKKTRDAYIEQFIAPIREMLNHAGLKYYMKGRTKSIHSIWQKMKKQKCAFEGVYDLFAIRIILDSPLRKEKQQCWQVYSLITDKYQPNPKRLRDWLSIPKSNGYESLHITVLGPESKWVEVQIRTKRMDDVAEHGLAAHWRYKGVKSEEGGIEVWLAGIRSALETGDDMQLMDQFKSELQEDEVYVFTPKGDLLKFQKGATILDFAFHIHSNVGCHCIGGKINGKNVSMRQPLNSGDTIEILTSTQQTPKISWVNNVVSSRAKSKIRQAVKEQQAKDSGLAKEDLERKLKNRKINWDETIINQLVKKSGLKEAYEFFRAIAEERLDINSIIEQYQELQRRENNQLERVAAKSAGEFNFEKEEEKRLQQDADVLVIDKNLKGIDFQMAKCCQPVYGDKVFGFVTVNNGIKIHRENCPNAAALRERFGYRIVKARWAGKGNGLYSITLRVVGNDDLGIVNNITSVIGKEEKVSLRSISIDSNDGLFSGILTININNIAELNSLIKKINGIKGVKSVTRT